MGSSLEMGENLERSPTRGLRPRPAQQADPQEAGHFLQKRSFGSVVLSHAMQGHTPREVLRKWPLPCLGWRFCPRLALPQWPGRKRDSPVTLVPAHTCSHTRGDVPGPHSACLGFRVRKTDRQPDFTSECFESFFFFFPCFFLASQAFLRSGI